MHRRPIVRKLMLSVMLLVTLSACSLTVHQGTETKEAVCDAWESSLPTRSSSDTEQTQDEIGTLYNVFRAVCPGRRVPLEK